MESLQESIALGRPEWIVAIAGSPRKPAFPVLLSISSRFTHAQMLVGRVG